MSIWLCRPLTACAGLCSQNNLYACVLAQPQAVLLSPPVGLAALLPLAWPPSQLSGRGACCAGSTDCTPSVLPAPSVLPLNRSDPATVGPPA